MSLWKEDRGPFENTLGLLSYTIPFIPGGGGILFLFEKLLSAYGMGANDFGKWIDQSLGLGPGSNITSAHEAQLIDLLEQKLNATSSGPESEIQKNASIISGLLKLVGGIPRIVKFIFTAVKVVLLALGVEKIHDVYQHVGQKGVAGLVPGVGSLFQQLPGEQTPKIDTKPDDVSNTTTIDPLKLVKMFGGGGI